MLDVSSAPPDRCVPPPWIVKFVGVHISLVYRGALFLDAPFFGASEVVSAARGEASGQGWNADLTVCGDSGPITTDELLWKLWRESRGTNDEREQRCSCPNCMVSQTLCARRSEYFDERLGTGSFEFCEDFRTGLSKS